jgi:hypothetical protein
MPVCKALCKYKQVKKRMHSVTIPARYSESVNERGISQAAISRLGIPFSVTCAKRTVIDVNFPVNYPIMKKMGCSAKFK